MNILSQEHIIDAAGTFADTAQTALGIEPAQFDNSQAPSPRYHDVAAAYHANDQQPSFEVPCTPEDRQLLAKYPGLRVTVSREFQLASGPKLIYFPGIVLDTAPGQAPRVGVLEAGPDMLRDETALAAHQSRPLSDLQQNLLNRLYGLQTRTAGQHSANGQTNVGESAHGALIAVTDPLKVAGLHGRVHQYVASGLARSISAAPRGEAGAVDIQAGDHVRPVRDNVVAALDTKVISVSKEHQLPPTNGFVGLGLGQLVVGTILAAVQTKARRGFPQPNLTAGMIAVTQR